MPAPLFGSARCSSLGIRRPSWNPPFSELFFRLIFEAFLDRCLTYLGPHFRLFWLVFNVIFAAVFRHRFWIDFSSILMSFLDPWMTKNNVFTADVSQKSRFCSFRRQVVFSSVFNHDLGHFWATFSHNFRTFSHYIWLTNFWLFFQAFWPQNTFKMDPKMASKNVKKSREARQGRQKCAQTLKGTILDPIWSDFEVILVSFWIILGSIWGHFWTPSNRFLKILQIRSQAASNSPQQQLTASSSQVL